MRDAQGEKGMGEEVGHAQGVGFDFAAIGREGAAVEEQGKLFTEGAGAEGRGAPEDVGEDGGGEVA
jgi:hypothetical protein